MGWEQYLKLYNANALVNITICTWYNKYLDNSIHTFLCVKPVLCNIIEVNGANNLVECTCGKEIENIKVENVIM